MADLYNRIDALAKERGYKNMTALCNAAGVPRATMTELKMGRSKSLLPETARKLAAALGVSLDAVFGIDKEKTKTPAAQGDGLTEAQKELMRIIPDLTEAEAAVLVATAKAQVAARKLRDAP